MAKIEIDLADLGLQGFDYEGDPTHNNTLQDLIIAAAVDRLLDTDLNREVRKQVDEQVRDAVAEKVAGLVEAAMTEPIQRTTVWGEKQGEPTTVRELIRLQIEKYLNEKDARNRYDNRNPQNLAELIQDQTQSILDGELRKTVAEAKKKVHEKVTERALEAAVKELNR